MKKPVIHKRRSPWRTQCGCDALGCEMANDWSEVTCKRCLATQVGKLMRHKITCKRCLATRKKKR